jgi:perosamine synthetase
MAKSHAAERARIPIARPSMGEREVEAAGRAIRSGWVTQGPEVAAFESEFAQYVGARSACAVSSGTTALHLALLAVGVRPGDEVVTVSHSFIATANAVRYCGATPVFVDIEPATFNINPALVEPAIGPKTRAILCVHQIGIPCDLAAILAVAERRAIPLVEDAACAIGSEILQDGRWERIGRPRGAVACFSFHPRKLVSTGDGGMLTTNDDAMASRLRRLRQHGMSLSDRSRHLATDVCFEQYDELGYNYRLTDIQAAVGREQLKRLPEAIARRRDLADAYRALLSSVPGLTPPPEVAWARPNYQSYCVRLPGGCDQLGVMQRMLDEGIATRRGVMCAHREPAYRDGGWSCAPGLARCACGASCARLRQSERAQDTCLLLPMFDALTAADQERVVDSLRRACASAGVPVTG